MNNFYCQIFPNLNQNVVTGVLFVKKVANNRVLLVIASTYHRPSTGPVDNSFARLLVNFLNVQFFKEECKSRNFGRQKNVMISSSAATHCNRGDSGNTFYCREHSYKRLLIKVFLSE